MDVTLQRQINMLRERARERPTGSVTAPFTTLQPLFEGGGKQLKAKTHFNHNQTSYNVMKGTKENTHRRKKRKEIIEKHELHAQRKWRN